MSHPATPALLHSAFYRFVPLADPAALAADLRVIGLACGLQGSVVVAHEGINGTLAGASAQVAAFEQAAQELQGGALRGMPFRHSACITAPFGRWKVVVKPEIVALGLPAGAGRPGTAAKAACAAEASGLPEASETSEASQFPEESASSEASGSPEDGHLDPQAWRALLRRDDCVLLDNRNHFEYRLGHFRGALDPQVHNFRDFVAYVQAHAPAWRAAGRPVAMYCTGGIRCDKTAPWLRRLGLDVHLLAGGVLNYFGQIDDADRDWQGECFVFDRRVALDCRLRETATTARQVYDPRHPDEAWRLRRALQLDAPAPREGEGEDANAGNGNLNHVPA